MRWLAEQALGVVIRVAPVVIVLLMVRYALIGNLTGPITLRGSHFGSAFGGGGGGGNPNGVLYGRNGMPLPRELDRKKVDTRSWCLNVKARYQVLPGISFGTMTPEKKAEFMEAKCLSFLCEDHPEMHTGIFTCRPRASMKDFGNQSDRKNRRSKSRRKYF